MGKLIIDSNSFSRMLKRISHEILEKNSGPEKLVLIGMHTRGVPIAKRIADFIEDLELQKASFTQFFGTKIL